MDTRVERMKALLLLVLLAGIPRAAFAQAAIAGSVTDPSDTPIPGVLVEASSPAIIEKTRTAVTDGSDVWGVIGGAIMKDRVWYFANAHVGGSTKKSPNVYYNLNAGDPNTWLYVPDLYRLEYSDRMFENASGRVTWQVTPRHRVSGFWDAQALCRYV